MVLSSERALSYLKSTGTIQQEETKLWHLSPLTLFNMFDEEKKTGANYIVEDIDLYLEARWRGFVNIKFRFRNFVFLSSLYFPYSEILFRVIRLCILLHA